MKLKIVQHMTSFRTPKLFFSFFEKKIIFVPISPKWAKNFRELEISVILILNEIKFEFTIFQCVLWFLKNKLIEQLRYDIVVYSQNHSFFLAILCNFAFRSSSVPLFCFLEEYLRLKPDFPATDFPPDAFRDVFCLRNTDFRRAIYDFSRVSFATSE